MLSLSEEGETQDEVGSLDKAVISEKVLVGAFREENLRRCTMGGILERCVDIEAARLILLLIIDIACCVVG